MSGVTEVGCGDEIIDYILGEHKTRYREEELALIGRAYEFAAEAHKGQFRKSGEPYINHCVETARNVATLLPDPTSVAAALLHDTIEDCKITAEELSEKFSPSIAKLVDGVSKVSSLKIDGTRQQQVETFRKLIIAMAQDPRVIVIKFSDRLHNLRTLDFLPPEKQRRIAEETLNLLAPLAGRFGMARLKSEMEDLSMKYLYPEEFQRLHEQLATRRPQFEATIQKVIDALQAEFAKQGIRATLQGRTKHLYSIWKKMQRQQVSLDSVYDIMAVRVICEDDVAACYQVLGIVHHLWTSIPFRFHDYIGNPKPNGYQTIHTTVIGPDNQRIEIQIRTRKMHEIAEEGLAAHWKYKEGVRGDEKWDSMLEWVRRLLEWVKDVSDPNDLFESLKYDLTSETVYCFTPKGQVIELPKGATALDFAYYIHTAVGESCVGARVNGRMVPLRYELNFCDVVEIKTSAKAHPSPDWLNIVKTSRARTKIKHWLRQQRLNAENITKGKDALAKALRSRGLAVDWDQVKERVAPLLKNYGVQSFDELCGEIGFGGIAAPAVVLRAFPEAAASQPKKHTGNGRKHNRSRPGVVVDGLKDVELRFAHCCNPLPGDEIVGYITIGRGVTVHTRNCKFVAHGIGHPELQHRFCDAKWDLSSSQVHEVGLKVECSDRQGLLADVTSAITSRNIFIVGSKTVSRGDKAFLKFCLQVKSLQELQNVFAAVRAVKGVLRVSRVSTAYSGA